MGDFEFNDKRRRLLKAGATAGVAGLVAGVPLASALAQSDYPNKPINFICPWPPGGTADSTMRALAHALGEQLGQSVVFENRAGASGMIGTRVLASAAPDGYTIGQIPISVVRFAQLGMTTFDPLKDLTYLGRTSGQTFGIVVRADSPYKTLADLVAAAKAKPGTITYASSGVGGATHVGMEDFCRTAGIKMLHVPYKGGAPALIDTLGGQVDVLVDSTSWAPYVLNGKMRLLVSWGAERPKRFQNAPTLKEAGYNLVIDAPNGVGAPAGLPADVQKKLGDAVRKAVASAEFRKACDAIDAPVLYLDGADYEKYVHEQYAHETTLIKELHLKQLLKRG